MFTLICYNKINWCTIFKFGKRFMNTWYFNILNILEGVPYESSSAVVENTKVNATRDWRFVAYEIRLHYVVGAILPRRKSWNWLHFSFHCSSIRFSTRTKVFLCFVTYKGQLLREKSKTSSCPAIADLIYSFMEFLGLKTRNSALAQTGKKSSCYCGRFRLQT